MKKTILLTAIMALACIASAQYRVLENGSTNLKIKFSAPQPETSTAKLFGQQYVVLNMNGFAKQTKEGLPTLPTLVTTAEIALCDGLSYNIESMVCDTLDAAALGIDMLIAPAQPTQSKSAPDPTAIVIDKKAYSSDAFLGAPVIELHRIGIARDRNLAHIVFNPVRWNPVKNQVIITREITINVKQHNADIDATRRMKRLHGTPAFGESIKTINAIGPKEVSNAPIRYTIVAHSSFRGALDEFAAWKRRKGFLVDLVYTDDNNVGSTTSSIKNYLQGLYDNATSTMPAPTYVLFVGDIEQIPAFSHSYSYDSHSSDLDYCCWTGNDNLPDCYYGRFSAKTLAQLEPQISKTMMYEQYTFPDPSYLSNAALIAGVDRGSTGDNAYTYGDPAMDYVAKTYVTTANGFNNIVYYKNNTSFAPTGVTVTGSSQASQTAQALRTFYNNGCGWVNYTAHGSTTSWGDPSLTTSHVSQLTNNNKPMFMIGNCCLTNSYQIDACFGEALLRKNNNAGAVIYIGASNSTYWVEDFYWSVGIRSTINNTINTNYDANNLGMYDRLFHSHGEAYSEHCTTAGSMVFAGNWAVENSSTGSDMKAYYWQIYHVMGDPALMPYIHGEANSITATHADTLMVGENTLTVTSIPYAYVSLKDNNGDLLSAAFANSNGVATLQFSPLSTVGEHELVITAQGYRPYFKTIMVLANGPYINVESMTSNAPMKSGSHIDFDITLKNIGIYAANSITVEIQCLDGSILLDTTGQISMPQSLNPNQEINLSDFIGGYIWPNVKDQTATEIKVITRWGNTTNDVAYKTFYFNINSDKIDVDDFNLGEFEDDAATLEVTYINNGHATLDSANITILPLEAGLMIAQPSIRVNNLRARETYSIDYTLELVGPMPVDHRVPFLITIDKGNCSYNDTLTILFGRDLQLIDFEDNSWGDYPWVHGTNSWTITNTGVLNGNYCARSTVWSGNNGSRQTSELSIVWTSIIDDSITFYKNVSSEKDYDKYYFLIDNTEKEQISGTENDWSRSSYYVPAGTHTFTFKYVKDYSVNGGSDCAWIDDLHLPLAGFKYIYIIDTVCQGEMYTFNNREINTDSIAAGIFYMNDTIETSIYNLTLIIGQQPNLSITSSADTIRAGETARLTASGANSYIWNTGERNPVIDVYPTETTTYIVSANNGSCSATASYTIVVDGTIGINTPTNVNHFTIYPNPASDIINIEGPASEIRILDINGRNLLNKTTTTDTTTIDVNSLQAGIYIIQITDNEGAKTAIKFIKK